MATHYKVVCISIYTRDLAALDAKVDELKRRGWRKANRSLVIRLAVAALDPATVEIPRGDDAGAGSHAVAARPATCLPGCPLPHPHPRLGKGAG